MKKLLGIITLSLFIILILLVFINMNKNTTLSLIENDDIIKNENIEFYVSNSTSKSIKYIIKNKSKEDIIYGAEYELQKYVDGSWYKYNITIEFIEIAYVLKPNEQNEEEIILVNIFGELESGKYRIIKEINAQKMSAEFEIK